MTDQPEPHDAMIAALLLALASLGTRRRALIVEFPATEPGERDMPTPDADRLLASVFKEA